MLTILPSLKGYLYCFFCLDSRDLFLGVGLDHLTVIVNEKCYGAALRIMGNVTPIFFGCPEKLTQEAR